MSTIQANLAANKAIDEQIDYLVSAASQRISALENSHQLEESQVRNLVSVADHTVSLEAVTNFIRYQIGRDNKSTKWASGSFGVGVIHDIEAKDGVVHKSLANVIQTENVDKQDTVKIRAKLVALYVGYLNRCFVYANKTKNYADLASRGNVLRANDTTRKETANGNV